MTLSDNRTYRIYLLIFAWMCILGGQDSLTASESLLIHRARQLFYQSVEHKDSLEKAIRLFKIIEKNEAYEGMALTYIGALTALKGKFAFLPITKYRRVLHGLELMDQGIRKSPGNIEARFIRGMTCFYLPFFFDRKKTAHEDFRHIVRKLHTEADHYDAGLIMNVTDFLIENAELTSEESERIKQIQIRVRENED
ncbi:hypothetical protein JW835_08410 [bacterium]|nr:hypothetical protein [bacterium]